jgi:uncharacterized protein YkwD
VGLAERDYMRTPNSPSRRGISFLGIAVVAFLALIIFSSGTRDWLRTRLGTDKPRVFTVKPFPFGPATQLGHLYPSPDHWAAFLPKPEACPGGTSAPTPPREAERAMICDLNYARTRDGLSGLPVSHLLDRSSRLKALDIIRCQEFSHSACGKDPRAVADQVGYPNVEWGENIYAGAGPYAPARLGADAWLNSPHHRENLFRSEWTEQGIAVVIAKHFRGQKNVAIWVSEFGRR